MVSGKFPEVWKQARMMPIFISGEDDQVAIQSCNKEYWTKGQSDHTTVTSWKT